MTNDLRFASARPARRSTSLLTRATAAGLVLAFAAGCTTTASPSSTPGSSGNPGTPPPSSTPVPDPSGNPTGATDILLRMETSGGMMLEANATAAPTFTLYGDGTVIFRDPNAQPPEPIGGVRREVPYQIVRLGPEGIQALILDALGPGGLAIATGPYQGMGADIPTTTFTVAADGQTKQVSISGFLPDLHPQDAVIVAALGQLSERLGAFGSSIAGEEPYTPAAYRGLLLPVDEPFGPVVDWPWADIAPADFAGGENDLFKTRTMTPDEIGEIGIPGVGGGFSGLIFKSGDELYSFMLRPLLPDETK
jgi:hypothetical protein